MLKRRLLLASALVGVELLGTVSGAQAGAGLAGVHGTHAINLGSVNCRNIGGGRQAGLNVYSPVNINTRVNNSTNISVNKPLNVYAPVNVTNNVDNSTNINATVNINNAKYIDNSTNVTVNKDIRVSTTNIFNGSGSSHDMGGNWGSHSGGMGGGGSNGNNNNNGNSNSNGNSNGNSNQNGSGNTNNNTINNSNGIDASNTISSFLNGLRGLQ